MGSGQRQGRRPSPRGRPTGTCPCQAWGAVLTAHLEVAAKTPQVKSPCPGACTSGLAAPRAVLRSRVARGQRVWPRVTSEAGGDG